MTPINREDASRPLSTTRWALWLPALSVALVALVAAASALTWLVVAAFESDVAFPPPAMLAAVAMLPVNVICLWLVVRLLRREERTVRRANGARSCRRSFALPIWVAVPIFIVLLAGAGTLSAIFGIRAGRGLRGGKGGGEFLVIALWSVLGKRA